jgi:hypothetical protein
MRAAQSTAELTPVQTSKRPIIFVAHSLGGIVVKSVSALPTASAARSTDRYRRSSTLMRPAEALSKSIARSSCPRMASCSWARRTRVAAALRWAG